MDINDLLQLLTRASKTKGNPFDTPYTPDLGTDSHTLDKDGVDIMFKYGHHTHAYNCVACGSKGKYQLVAKHPSVDTAEIEKGQYICQHCLDNKAVSPELFGIRKIGRSII